MYTYKDNNNEWQFRESYFPELIVSMLRKHDIEAYVMPSFLRQQAF